MKTLNLLLVFTICNLLNLSANKIEKIREYTSKDTVLVLALVKKARQSFNQYFDSAFIYSKKAIAISEKIGYTKGKAWGYHRISQSFGFVGSIDSAIKYGNLARQYFKSINDSLGLAHVLYEFGNDYLYKSWYNAALKYFLDANVIYQKLNSQSDINNCHASIGIVYFYLKDWRKSLHYLILNINYEIKTNNDAGLSEDYCSIGSVYDGLGKSDSSKMYLKLAEKVALKVNNIRALTTIYNNLGIKAKDEKDYTLALGYLTKSIELKKSLHNNDGLGGNYINLGDIYAATGNFQKALYCLKKGIEYCKELNFREDLVRGYKSLSELYEKNGDTKNALLNYKNYLTVNDTLALKKYSEQVAQWQTLYELKNNEFQLVGAKSQLALNQITIQKNKISQQFLIALVALVVLFSFLIYRSIRIKHIIVEKENEIQKHKIGELEKEKILLATQSILQGEEIERKRLARDLHDGLGGLLSGTKLAFNNMKNNVVLPHESVNDFNQALVMLDTSITELRRVAHNMMPDALMKLGLKDALSDFCTELNKGNPLHIIFQFYGQFNRLESNLEINVYRITQELINNAIKHSGATELVVQIMQESTRLCLMVMDNGFGFDTTKTDIIKGVGLSSVKSRVEAFNGKMEIDSTQGKGTEISIEFTM